MKNRLLVTSLAALALGLPAFAQTSTDQAAAPASTTSTTNATGKEPLAPQTHEGFWGKVPQCPSGPPVKDRGQ